MPKILKQYAQTMTVVDEHDEMIIAPHYSSLI